MIRRVMMISVAIAFIMTVVAMATVAMWVCNDRIMSADTPKLMRFMVATFFPPRDLYDVVVRSEIDLSRVNIKEVIFKAKYRGRHEAGILLRNFDPDKFYGTQYTFPLRLKLTFVRGSTPIISKLVGASPNPFIGKEASGFGMLTIDVPGDFPIGELVTCRIEVVSPDAVLNGIYGPAEIFVRKISDK